VTSAMWSWGEWAWGRSDGNSLGKGGQKTGKTIKSGKSKAQALPGASFP